MFKRSRLITLICILILAIVAATSMTLINTLPKLLNKAQGKLVFTSESLSGPYDGNALTASGWDMVSGSLKDGHTAQVTVKGTQKNVGTSENYFTVKIVDENGKDVTDEYDIEYRPGTLTVEPAVLTVFSDSDYKVYDGTPLTNSGYRIFPDYALPPRHTIDVKITGSITEIGKTANTVASVRIYDQKGKDVTYSFDIIVTEGILEVLEDISDLPGSIFDGKLNLDTDGDGIPDLNLDIDGDGFPDLNLDFDGDGFPDLNLDFNGDGIPDLNLDANGDFLPDLNLDTNGDGRSDVNIDLNGDGIPDLNVDTDGDNRADMNIDTNGNYTPDKNVDEDGDGVPDSKLDEDYKDNNIDTDGDGEPDLNIDKDGDGKPDLNIDTNGDGKPDVNVDTTGDVRPNINLDTNGDNIADKNIDTDGDGEPDKNMAHSGGTDIDTDGDGNPDLNVDTDGDGEPDLNIDINGDGVPDTNIDTNGDGKPDVNVDKDGDGKPETNIDTDGDNSADTDIDTNGNGVPDKNVDKNGDGVPDTNIDTSFTGTNVDTDGDGMPDLNVDKNGDGVPDTNIDTNGDGKPDVNVDTDGNGVPDYNLDTNGDNIADRNIDYDGDGKPDKNLGYIGGVNIDTNGDKQPDINIDTDGDGRADINIDLNGDKKPDINVDTSGDGKADVNLDTGGDLIPDVNVDLDGNNRADVNIDTNGDKQPDRNIDTNGDGIPDKNVDYSVTDNNRDTDGDGKADLNIDKNGDGKPDVNTDTNGDGKPEVNVDVNGDGKADINLDTDGDNISDKNIDTNGDKIPDKNLVPTGTGGSGGSAGGSGGSGGGYGGSTGSIGGSTSVGDETMYVIRSGKSGTVYLKIASYGDYYGYKWLEAESYDMLLNGTHSASYLTAIALAGSGAVPYDLKVKIYNEQLVIPYYMIKDKSGRIQTSDIYAGGSFSQTMDFVYYDSSYKNASLPDAFKEYELAYREYVYENYLDTYDQETLAYMQAIIAMQGFDKSSPTVVEDVAAFIRGCAVYNLDYPEKLDMQTNIAVAFLKDYREGVCRHFASAATLLYRALGIPARYTTGFVGETVANQDVEVKAKNAHAWVEVYIDGVGWVVSEVTGSSVAEEEKISLTVAPEDVDKLYDGTPLSHNGRLEIIDAYGCMTKAEFEKSGYRLEAVVIGERTEPGKGTSTISSVKVFDKNGNDVTSKFDINKKSGILHVYVAELRFGSAGKVRPYDGTALSGEVEDVYLEAGEMQPGHIFEATISAGARITYAGKCSNAFNVKICDENGNDKTDIYKITKKYGVITVSPREITIQAGSATKVYDGTPLTCDEAYIVSGSLATGTYAIGDEIQIIVVEGSQTNRGKHDNVVTKIVIVNVYGTDVTSSYKITFLPGTLTVTGK